MDTKVLTDLYLRTVQQLAEGRRLADSAIIAVRQKKLIDAALCAQKAEQACPRAFRQLRSTIDQVTNDAILGCPIDYDSIEDAYARCTRRAGSSDANAAMEAVWQGDLSRAHAAAARAAAASHVWQPFLELFERVPAAAT